MNDLVGNMQYNWKIGRLAPLQVVQILGLIIESCKTNKGSSQILPQIQI
jgi:hypothetical protein